MFLCVGGLRAVETLFTETPSIEYFSLAPPRRCLDHHRFEAVSAWLLRSAYEVVNFTKLSTSRSCLLIVGDGAASGAEDRAHTARGGLLSFWVVQLRQ